MTQEIVLTKLEAEQVAGVLADWLLCGPERAETDVITITVPEHPELVR